MLNYGNMHAVIKLIRYDVYCFDSKNIYVVIVFNCCERVAYITNDLMHECEELYNIKDSKVERSAHLIK